MRPMPPVMITAAVEGPVDEAVVRVIVAHVGASPGDIHGKNGKAHLRQRIAGYNKAAHFSPWFVLVDLNQEENCASPLRRSWLPEAAPHICFRIAVREVESWLLADRERIASFLDVPLESVPGDPDSLPDPKTAVVELARRSRTRDIREDMVPRPGSGRAVGPAYASRLIEFVATAKARWRPAVASQRSESLRRAIACLRKLVRAERSKRTR